MRVEIAEHGRMSESGSSLLRLIQNQNMPLLDLLVREATQNSLDAARAGQKKVNMEFNVGKFMSDELNVHFESITDALDAKFPPSMGGYSFIAVRDSNTQGLTGPVKYEEIRDNNFGNLLKLVYEICKPQQNEGAGGSWGLGKTIYFRIGIGLVVYYSRIWQDDRYISRLAACLVEDETKEDALIPYQGGVKRGIAWWGESDGKDKTVPVEDEQQINALLNVFGIQPYCGEETGTTIIIPYINERALLDEVYATNEDQEYKPYWAGSVEEYLKAAIQKWYAPRLLNPHYNYGAYLSPSVCGNKMKVSSMLPLFRVIRELYILSQEAELESDALISGEGVEPQVVKINLNSVFTEGSTAGNFVYVKLNKQQLLMGAPDNNRTPYQQIDNAYVNMDGGNTPIVMYTRRPGMIVGYDYDSIWTHGMPKSGEDEYIIGLFVLNSSNKLRNISARSGENLLLEEYIRQGEKADHASWTDRNINGNNPRIVSNIQKNVIRKITSKFTIKTQDTSLKRNLGLGHALANILLPASDFGRAANIPGKPGGGSGEQKRSGKHSALKVINPPKYKNGNICVDFELYMRTPECEIKLLVITDFKKYDADTWESEDEIGKAFPLMLKGCFIETSKGKSKKSPVIRHDISVGADKKKSADKVINIEMLSSGRFSINNMVKVHSAESEITIRGRIIFRAAESSVKSLIDIKEVQ